MPSRRWLVCACFLLQACFLLSSCGGTPEESGSVWRHCRIEGLENASGLALHRDELLAVAGDNDRAVYAFTRSGLTSGGRIHARKLDVHVKEDTHLVGAEKFSEQGYQMKHLWKLPLDFQALATRTPSHVFLGDRNRRIVYWGRLVRDGAGRLSQVQISRLFVAPGATRSDISRGDWRDKGPGLSGLAVVQDGQRSDDLYVVDRGERDGRFLRLRKTDMYGSVLGGTLVERDFEGAPESAALSWWQSQFLLLRAAGAGHLMTVRESSSPEPRKPAQTESGPEVAGAEAWTGMCHAPDGTIYLVSSGSPAIVAWRTP